MMSRVETSRPHVERSWACNVTLTTRSVDAVTAPQSLELVQVSGFDPTVVATRTFPMDEAMAAYDAFSRAGETAALHFASSPQKRG